MCGVVKNKNNKLAIYSYCFRRFLICAVHKLTHYFNNITQASGVHVVPLEGKNIQWKILPYP
jgi:hypothetical protein